MKTKQDLIGEICTGIVIIGGVTGIIAWLTASTVPLWIGGVWLGVVIALFYAEYKEWM